MPTVSLVVLIAAGLGLLAFLATAGLLVWVFLRRPASPVAVPVAVAVRAPVHDAAPQGHLVGGLRQIKRVRCRSCGAAKVREPRTAFLYCDYCGALVDWDFRISITTAGSAKPGPEYQRLQVQLAPQLADALGRGDRTAYRETLTRLLDQHMRSCPAAYSPRLGDQEYRAGMLEFQVACILETDFDPETQRLRESFEAAQRSLRPYPRPGLPAGIGADDARRLCAAFLAHHERFMTVAAPHIHTHPDQAPFELISSIQKSIFAQTYLRNLEQPDQAWLIAELDLEGDYAAPPDVPTDARHCGGCGAEMAVVRGARAVVCEYCGLTNDVERPEVRCAGCGAPVTLVVGRTRLQCPHCSADLRVD